MAVLGENVSEKLLIDHTLLVAIYARLREAEFVYEKLGYKYPIKEQIDKLREILKYAIDHRVDTSNGLLYTAKDIEAWLKHNPVKKHIMFPSLPPLPESELKEPPIGLVPEKIWIQKRFRDVCDAITRYIAADLPVPAEWWAEWMEGFTGINRPPLAESKE